MSDCVVTIMTVIVGKPPVHRGRVAGLCCQVCPPELKDTPDAPRQADERLRKMGPMSRDERIMLAVMVAAIIMWVLGDQLQIAPVTAAMLGLAALLISGVLKWKECLEYNQVLLSASSALALLQPLPAIHQLEASACALLGLASATCKFATADLIHECTVWSSSVHLAGWWLNMAMRTCSRSQVSIS